MHNILVYYLLRFLIVQIGSNPEYFAAALGHVEVGALVLTVDQDVKGRIFLQDLPRLLTLDMILLLF